ncbi:MAG: Glycosyltransferases involved in cell wall bioproteini, partial [Elusimicrobia bacterium]
PRTLIPATSSSKPAANRYNRPVQAKKLSIIVPVYNEKATVEQLIARVQTVKLPLSREIIAVDDASTDGSGELLDKMKEDGVVVVRHPKNRGKGAAIRTGLALATGDLVLIQDADLEYDPSDFPTLLAPLLDGRADAVYGSQGL